MFHPNLSQIVIHGVVYLHTLRLPGTFTALGAESNDVVYARYRWFICLVSCFSQSIGKIWGFSAPDHFNTRYVWFNHALYSA